MNIGTILIAVLIFSVLIFFHELGHFVFAKLARVRVNEFAIGMGPVLLKAVRGETQYSLRMIPMGGFCALEGDDGVESDNPRVKPDSRTRPFPEAGIGSRIMIMMAGSMMNLILGLILLGILSTQLKGFTTTTVDSFHEGAVSNAWLQEGDEILRVNGHRVRTGNDLSYQFMRDRDGVLDLLVQRGGKTVQLYGVQFKMVDIGDGIQAIYFDFAVRGIPRTPLGTVKNAFNWTATIIKEVWGSLIDLLTGRYGLNQLSGPVGVATAIGGAASNGWRNLMMMSAFITVNLGVFNLLPVPALDGGRLLFLFIEAVRRKPLNPRYEGMVHTVGFMLLIGLIIFATVNDVLRLI